MLFTLNLQVEDDLIRAEAVTGYTGVVPRVLGFHCADHQAAVARTLRRLSITAGAGLPLLNHMCVGWLARTQTHSDGQGILSCGWFEKIEHWRMFFPICDVTGLCSKVASTYVSFSHLTVGAGSPTALQGNTMSLIQGVVTVPLKVRIRAGAAETHTTPHMSKAPGSL